jgi:hypothetical protein
VAKYGIGWKAIWEATFDDAAPTAGEHLRQEPAGERDDRLDVQAHEPAFPFRRRRSEGTVSRHAGIVDEQLGLELSGTREHRLDPGGDREIGDERLEPAAACFHLAGEGVQALAPACHREHGVAPLAER